MIVIAFAVLLAVFVVVWVWEVSVHVFVTFSGCADSATLCLGVLPVSLSKGAVVKKVSDYGLYAVMYPADVLYQLSR